MRCGKSHSKFKNSRPSANRRLLEAPARRGSCVRWRVTRRVRRVAPRRLCMSRGSLPPARRRARRRRRAPDAHGHMLRAAVAGARARCSCDRDAAYAATETVWGAQTQSMLVTAYHLRRDQVGPAGRCSEQPSAFECGLDSRNSLLEGVWRGRGCFIVAEQLRPALLALARPAGLPLYKLALR